ncbi:MAG TPA: hypothetical protein VE776_00830 [Actinomycetota bacterium]|jgi:hypothetical protein|nr:hypothetical protein [Actinomycetota bacterium]
MSGEELVNVESKVTHTSVIPIDARKEVRPAGAGRPASATERARGEPRRVPRRHPLVQTGGSGSYWM